MRQVMVKLLLLLVCSTTCLVHHVLGHGILVQPTPRVGTNVGTGIKLVGKADERAEQCGAEAGANVTGAIMAVYQAGTKIKVVWDTTIVHPSPPGVRISIKYTENDTFAGSTLANGLDIGPKGCNNAYVALPAGKTCDSCVLQWMWETSADGGFYIGCSDIKIQAAAVPDGTNSDDYMYSVCGGAPSTTTGNSSDSDGHPGLSPGAVAAITIFIIGAVGFVVGCILFVKMKYGTIDTKYPFFHRIKKKSPRYDDYVAFTEDL